MNKQLEKEKPGEVLKPKEALPGEVIFSPTDDIEQLQTRIDGLGKELSLNKEQKAEIFREATERQTELDEIEGEVEEQALESIEGYFTKMIGPAQEKIKEGVDKILTPILTKFSEVMPKERLEKVGRSLKRKMMVLVTTLVVLQPTAVVAEMTDKQIDDAALAAVPETLVNVDADTTTIAVQEAFDKGVITEEELEKYTPPETKAKPKYKYPEDSGQIEENLERLIKEEREDMSAWWVERMIGRIEVYNREHPDDWLNTADIISSAPPEAQEEVKKYLDSNPDAVIRLKYKYSSDENAKNIEKNLKTCTDNMDAKLIVELIDKYNKSHPDDQLDIEYAISSASPEVQDIIGEYAGSIISAAELKLRYKYPGDGKQIEQKFRAAIKEGRDPIEKRTSLMESQAEINTYNKNHPDDEITIAKLCSSLSPERKVEIKENAMQDLKNEIKDTRESCAKKLNDGTLPQGKKNIRTLLDAMAKAAEVGDLDKVNKLWGSVGDYYPDASIHQELGDQPFKDYDNALANLKFQLEITNGIMGK